MLHPTPCMARIHHCSLTLSSPQLTQYSAHHSVASCTLLPPVAANAFSLYQARGVDSSANILARHLRALLRKAKAD